ncbi:hypothetical protein WOLCODRAFT_148555 [Wolfiporia cocos MD-104 SS10]|uniref:Uncharacterized protein n=1 Tax=Wolfiporia cocos (strain MD-104) TaxID=742152 RepID=A0A2H3JEU0_WOLCO|nr:hypothetical protein WOLCODRAFT_148555 [Wolfiporia cocos MD-104 SS10]
MRFITVVVESALETRAEPSGINKIVEWDIKLEVDTQGDEDEDSDEEQASKAEGEGVLDASCVWQGPSFATRKDMLVTGSFWERWFPQQDLLLVEIVEQIEVIRFENAQNDAAEHTQNIAARTAAAANRKLQQDLEKAHKCEEHECEKAHRREQHDFAKACKQAQQEEEKCKCDKACENMRAVKQFEQVQVREAHHLKQEATKAASDAKARLKEEAKTRKKSSMVEQDNSKRNDTMNAISLSQDRPPLDEYFDNLFRESDDDDEVDDDIVKLLSSLTQASSTSGPSQKDVSDGDHNNGNHNNGNHNDGNHNDGNHNDGNHNDGNHNDGNHNDGDHNGNHDGESVSNTMAQDKIIMVRAVFWKKVSD